LIKQYEKRNARETGRCAVNCSDSAAAEDYRQRREKSLPPR